MRETTYRSVRTKQACRCQVGMRNLRNTWLKPILGRLWAILKHRNLHFRLDVLGGFGIRCNRFSLSNGNIAVLGEIGHCALIKVEPHSALY